MDLIALEEIRSLKHRYLRTLDLKLWEEFGDTLAADVTTDYGSPSGGRPLKFTDREQVVSYMSSALGPGVTSVHVCSHPELTLTGEDTAGGTWCLEDTVLVAEHKLMIKGAAYYTDTYRREDGVWRISSTRYQRLYEAIIPYDSLPGFRITANLWPPPA